MPRHKKPDPSQTALAPKWPAGPIGVSSPNLLKLLDLRDEILQQDAEAADSIGYVARILVQTTLPHRDPGPIPVWWRADGQFTLQIASGFSTATQDSPPRPLGLPFGVYPRVVLAYLMTEAIRTRSPELFLGRSFADFIGRLGLEVRGGERGTIRRLKDQMTRLTKSSIEWRVAGANCIEDGGIRPIKSRVEFWDTSRPRQEALWQSSVVLTTDFYDEIMRAPVPVDMRVVRHLARLRSPLAMDVYNWLTWRQHRLLEAGHPRLVIPWESLARQFGADYKRVRAFKSAFAEALRVVLVVYPDANAAPADAGLVLTPGRPHVRSAPARRQAALQAPATASERAAGAEASPAAPNGPEADSVRFGRGSEKL